MRSSTSSLTGAQCRRTAAAVQRDTRPCAAARRPCARLLGVAVLVDQPLWWWRGRRWCHVVSDELLNELHAFAAAAGLRLSPAERRANSALGSA
jgi:hypothetical protein